jgi:23S rRNA (adenine2503-C2)-methyltransferase
MIDTKGNFFDQDLSDLKLLLTSWGEPDYRADQIWRGIYQGLKDGPDRISNIPKSLRAKLRECFAFRSLTPETSLYSNDRQTVKTLFRLVDNQAIETVLMYYDKRRTLCISTQSGCAMGCVFCATGQMGFRRNLTSGEIVEQVIYFARHLKENDERLTNIVIMGMGEPFHNYTETMAAVDRLNHPSGMNLGARRFTISTVGLIPEILRFANDHRQVNLAVSLHAADDELRNSMLPINRKYPLDELIDACREYVKMTHRRITFEWALIYNINDSLEQASLLANLLRGLLCHVNIIPLNPTDGYSGKATTMERARIFRAELERQGIPCTIRVRRGIEIQAGCGQLASDKV